MTAWLVLAFVAPSLAAIAWQWQRWRLRSRVRDRLADGDRPEEIAAATNVDVPPLLRRYRREAWGIALLAGLGLYFVLDLGPWFSPAIALVVGLLLSRAESFWFEYRTLQLEQQLGAALDLLTSALQAGSSLLAALESTVRELKRPLRDVLEELAVRIRLGDAPQTALDILLRRAPLENVLLFTASLSVHWEVGGSLGPTLAAVSRTVRDRIEIARRMHALSMQSRVTTLVVLASVYFIGLLMWRNDPGRMEAFIATTFGQAAIAIAIVLQAAGIVWIGVISKPRF